MATASGSVSARRSRRIAGLEPQKLSNGGRRSSENVVGLRRGSGRSTTASSVSGINTLNTDSGSFPLRILARGRCSIPCVQMVEQMTSPTTSDSSSQTSDAPVITPEQSQSAVSGLPTDQPSTSSHGSGSGNMGTAFGSNRTGAAGTGGENEARDASRRRHHRRRHAQHRAIMAAYRGIPSSMPVKGESYCDCPKQGRDLTCTCGEEDTGLLG